MDQTQWKALNQMIAKQTSSGTSQKTSSGAAQTQYKTVLAGNQQQQHILSSHSTQATTSVGRPTTAGQRVTQRQSVNGATRSQPAGTGETEIVKSLLTGRQYGQSILRPDIVSRGGGGRQAARSGAQKAAGKQVSLLQTNYQQSQVQVDAGQTSSIQLDQNMLQQLVCSPEMMSAAPGPGEVMYVMAGNVTYQIVGPSQPGAEITAIPVVSGISLDELATISAQQESLKPEQLAGYQLQAGDASSATMVLQDMLQTSLDGQQYLQTSLDGTITTTTDDGMQIVMMGGDGYTGGTESTAQFGRDGEGASTIKLGGQDFILQAGQTLPPELQEMVDKGLPIDWSKYEFVIEGGENGPETTDAATFMMAQASADQSEALRLQEMALLQETGTGAEDNFAAGADYVKTESNDDMSAHSSMGVQFVTAAPGEYDDGEFSYLASPTRDEDPSQASGEVEPRVIPYSGFLHSFLDFVQGKGTETLSSVANCTIMGKPPMPKYLPPETGSASKAKDDLQKKYKGTPMTIIYTDANDPTGGSYIVTKSVEDPLEKGKQSVGKRKRSQLDSEGEDGSLENAEKMYRLSEDDFDSKKLDDPNLIRGRGRGRGRSSSAGRPVVSETDRHLGVMSLLDSTVPDSAVIHVTQSEPHCFQKGDFVIDRKDAYKLDSYPIWRIENGKLLQKFDPSLEDGILVHKSASVYSSWSGDIRDNFKPIMVEVISQTATTVGRKQDITVHVLDKYKTKAPDDSLEQNPLLQLFNIYVQMLLNHAVDSNYLLAVQEQKVDYYLTPMNQIDHLLIEAEQAVLSEISWLDDFKAELEAWSCYAVVGLRTDQVTLCQATPGSNKGIMTVKFYGQTYDRNFLTVESETTIANAKEFVIGKATFDNLGIYHSLHHFKFLLFRKCREEVNYVKSTMSGKSYEEAVDECVQNRIWVQQLFLDLKGLLERYIIIKTEDEAVEGDTATAGTH